MTLTRKPVRFRAWSATAPMDLKEGDSFEVEIERILPGGVGLAHAAERTILVSLAAPGDHLRVKVDRLRAKVAFASIIEILRPSPFRVEPPCPYFGGCGGCDFQQLSYEAQLKAKADIIRDCLHRITRIENLPEISVVASPRQWHYRSRANWQVDSKKRKVGYYERGTHEVFDVADCAVLVPELQQVLDKVRATDAGILPNEIDAVCGVDGVSLTPEIAAFRTTEVTRTIGTEDYGFSATSFFQINHDLLTELIVAAVGDAQGQTAVDLYCGVGLFTLPLARRFSQVLGIESNVSASRYARRNLTNAKLQNARIITARVGDWLKSAGSSLEQADFLLLDPPRSGAEPKVVQGILALHPTRVSYVACDPATLARDLKNLLAGGYRLESILAFDMFPQTHHVETIARLLKHK